MDQKQLQEQQTRWKTYMELPIIIGGVCFVLDIAFLPNLVQTYDLSKWQTCSLFFLALSLPLLAINALTMRMMITFKKVLPGKNMWLWAFQWVGWLTSILGVTISIINVSLWIGIIFFVLAIFAFVFVLQMYNILSST